MSGESEKPEMPSDAEIEQRFSKIKENLTYSLDDVDTKLGEIINGTTPPALETDEFDQRLDEISRKANDMKERRDAKIAEEQKETRLTQEANAGLGMGMTIAYTILGVPLLGALVGVALKQATGKEYWMAVMTLAGLVLGVLSAIFLIQKNNKNSK